MKSHRIITSIASLLMTILVTSVSQATPGKWGPESSKFDTRFHLVEITRNATKEGCDLNALAEGLSLMTFEASDYKAAIQLLNPAQATCLDSAILKVNYSN